MLTLAFTLPVKLDSQLISSIVMVWIVEQLYLLHLSPVIIV